MSEELIPIHWPKEWTDASKLDLIKGTPINCLAGETAPPFSLGGIPFVPLNTAQAPAGISVVEGVWPQVKSARQRDTTDAGPTGAPWVDSNGWRIQLARAREPEKELWLQYGAPKDTEAVRPEDYALPVAEAAAFGAHWVISLNDEFRRGLEARNDTALAAWKNVIAALEFAQKHSEWKKWKPVAALGVISDFEGENEFLASEFLNLAARRHLSYRVILKSKAETASFAGLKALLYVDAAAPEGELRKELLGFVNDGGLLFVPTAISQAQPVETKGGYQIRKHGKGRIAIPQEAWADPYVLAADVHLLLSHREDVVRIWNAGTMDSHYVASADGKHAAVHLVNYSQRGTLDAVTVGFDKPYGSANFLTLQNSTAVKPVKRRLGAEVALPAFQTYGVIELTS